MEDERYTHSEGKIELLSGKLIDAYEKKADKESAQGNTPEERMLFLQNAFFLYSKADRILQDSRMFLAPISMGSGVAYCGEMRTQTLGAYIEFWQTCSTALLAGSVKTMKLGCCYSGSPMTGSNSCGYVDVSGKLHSMSIPNFLKTYRELARINRRYSDVRHKYESYSMQEVVDILKAEGKIEGLDELFVLQLENRGLKTQVDTLYKELSRCWDARKALHEKYIGALIRLHFEEAEAFYQEYKRRETETEERLNALAKQKGEFKKSLKERNLSQKEAQYMFVEFKRQRLELKMAFSQFAEESLKRIFPEERVFSHDILNYFENKDNEQV